MTFIFSSILSTLRPPSFSTMGNRIPEKARIQKTGDRIKAKPSVTKARHLENTKNPLFPYFVLSPFRVFVVGVSRFSSACFASSAVRAGL
jgi:hypothetical protein